MKKWIRRLTAALLLCCAASFAAVAYGNWAIPDTVQVLSEDDEYLPAMFTRDADNVRFLHTVAVKKNSVRVSSRVYAQPLGRAFGIKLYTEGVMVVRADAVDTEQGSVSPAKDAGVRAGDMILSVDGQSVHTNRQLAAVVMQSGGQPMRLRVRRDGLTFETTLTAVQSALDGQYRAGIWVRDSSAGIGTLTFCVPEYGMFAGLGHAVCDVDTGKLLPLSDGEAVEVEIKGSYKGRDGDPGELCGVFKEGKIGTLLDNTESGIYGSCACRDDRGLMPVAMYYEVQTGDAAILAEVDDSGPQAYSVQITKLFSNPDARQKNLIVKVTDPDLIAKTGGIVQGMSGSPILQNGMIVGAVTHVFVQDPLQGFGVYAQTMVRQMQELTAEAAS
ncbi:MAG: SpoIVB peptidase [Clostridia bacterium]|nr:SpoIVB peptidase [Clostridia bacterium]